MTIAAGAWRKSLSPADIEGFETLAELALDLHWSWNHCTDTLWRRLDAELWQRTQNPWAVLQTVSRDRLRKAFADPAFSQEVDERARSQRAAADAPAWFQDVHGTQRLSSVAYFSMEFMLSEALPIYAGGLGNVAGDQLKAASDLGVPVVGVGLLYQQGYFRQLIDADGRQRALYPYNDPDQLPITPLRRPDGEWLRLKLDLLGHSIWLRGWQAKVGRVPLYLLDTNDPANAPIYRAITGELYGGEPEQRLMQELVLGIGGWRLLATLGIHPEVCHLNEGHAALAVLERARQFMASTGQPFKAALAATRAGNVFTTHTAVAAGFDRFSPTVVDHCLGAYARQQLGISLSELLALGRQDGDDANEDFNMAYLAMRGAGAVNAVSRLHGAVSRRLFQPLFAHWPESEVPVGHVTNGVHVPTWDSAAADSVWTESCGKDRWLQPTDTLEACIRGVTDTALWEMRSTDRRLLINYARDRLSDQLTVAGAEEDSLAQARRAFDPGALTLGFARRFAIYKRPALMLHDQERLLRLLSNRERPVQLIVAGKAHPDDRAGQELIQQWTRFAQRLEAREHVMFLADYDMLLTEHMVRGVDVWINTPRRPWEASGTSGMKVLVNGGLNVSELDGWWAEAHTPRVGWAIGDGREHGDDPAWDAAEATALYDLLEQAIIPQFYDRDARGIPPAWIARMRESMARLTPYFSSNRVVREYTEQYYLPAAAKFRDRAANNGAVGREIAEWRATIAGGWTKLRFGGVKFETHDEQYFFEVHAFLADVSPDAVQAELFADGVGEGPPMRRTMLLERRDDEAGWWRYHAAVPANRPTTDYTARLIPTHPGITIPLEAAEIMWQR